MEDVIVIVFRLRVKMEIDFYARDSNGTSEVS